MHRCLLQIYAKHPAVGEVKTRLGQSLGQTLATRLYVVLLDATLDVINGLPEAEFAIQLYGDQQASAPEYKRLLTQHTSLQYRQQGVGSLGQRLQIGLRRGLLEADQVLMIGADCPPLTAAHVMAARRSLCGGADAVIIPASDGGYVLIGFNRSIPGVFNTISWSTPLVLAQTRSALLRAGATVTILDELWDVDTVDDWRRYHQWMNFIRDG